MAPLPSIGAFYHSHLAREILDSSDLIDHLAMADSPDPFDPHWPAIRSRFTLLLHDYLGELSDPLDEQELQRARRLLEQYGSPWAAEHLQRLRGTTAPGSPPPPRLDYVFPPLYTEDLLKDFARTIRTLQQHLKVPLALEPIPTYLRLEFPQMSESEFLRRLCDETGCRLLLDVTHTVLSARGLGRDPTEFLLEQPLDRVLEIHVAGCATDPDLQEPWIAPVLPEPDLLDLAVLAASRAPALRAVTFDAYSPHLSAGTLLSGVRLLRERFT
jgi:uncharacterized protein (UPF0276 family)